MRPRSVFAGTALLLLLAVGTAAKAEVSAVLDESGVYQCMSYRYNVSAGYARIWSVTAVYPSPRTLNPSGDTIGDQAPTVVENPAHLRWPTAVWARRVDTDYDLVYSAWDGAQWTAVQYVQMDTPYNELEPRLAFNSTGRLYMAWWSDRVGGGAVYLSLFVNGHWTAPVQISTTGTDSRHPSLVLLGDDTALVSFETAHGVESREVRVVRSDSITDDIDPKLQVTSP